MSASKDALAGVPFGAGGTRGRSVRVSRARPCPACGHTSWCLLGAEVVLCMRAPSPEPRVNRDGVAYYVHRAGGAVPAWELPEDPAPVARVGRASAEDLDRAHRVVLARLHLEDRHRRALEARGLPSGEIEARGYRTLPAGGRARLARAVVEALGELAAAGVPGVHLAERDGRRWWSFGGAPGLLVPVRDVAGRVVALKTRVDEPRDGQRYFYVSSARHGGAAAACAVHVPLGAYDRATVRVTEGELKADVATTLSGLLTISVPGYGAWRAALPVLAELGARTVRVAFDQDEPPNPHVAAAARALACAVRAAGLGLALEAWDPADGKGIDDVLLNQGGQRV